MKLAFARKHPIAARAVDATIRIQILALAMVLCGASVASQNQRIDRTFSATGDVTGDGVPAVLTIHITGESMRSPFKWTFTITDNGGAAIYSVERDDTWLNKFFGDKGYVGNCADYVDCKQRYYFRDLSHSLFSCIRGSKDAWATDEWHITSTRGAATAYLVKQELSAEAISKAVDEMLAILGKPGFHTLDVPVSAVQSEAPMIWVPSIRTFVPYYQE
jgi:hypothetical protein